MATYPEKMIVLRDGREAILRSLVPGDAAAFVEMHRYVSRETQFTMQRPEDPATVERSEKRFQSLKDDPESLMLGLFVGTELAGITGLHSFWPGHPWVIHSRSFGMMVRKDYWGTGAAKLLMEALFDFADRNGIRRIEGRVRASNPRGIAFYRKMGFAIEGTHPLGAVIDGVEVAEHTIARLR